MISIANYFHFIKSVDVNSLPQALQEGHQFFIEAESVYDQDESIKETIDIYLQKLNEYFGTKESKAQPDSGSNEAEGKASSPPRVKPKENTAQAKNKPPQKSKVLSKKKPPKSKVAKPKSKSQPKMVASQSKDVAFIKRFVNMHNKVKSRHQINLFIKALQKAIVGREIRKTSKYASHIKEIQKKLCDQHNKMNDGDSIKVTINEQWLNELVAAAGGEKVYKSVQLIKRYIGLQGEMLITRIESLLKAVQTALSKKEISCSDPYYDKIKTIQKNLEAAKEGGKVKIEKAELSGLEGILNACGCAASSPGLEEYDLPPLSTAGKVKKKPNKPLDIFDSMDQLDSRPSDNSFRLKGDLGELLGDLERFELAITLEGDQGGGKTRFSYQLANAFAEIGLQVAVFSLEIGRKSDLIRRMKEAYLVEANQKNVFITDKLPEGLETIYKASKAFDVVLIDSWNKLDVHSSEFDKLRKSFPNTIFVVIFQRTTQGTIRGGTAPLYDSGINIEVVKADEEFSNNYATTTKNRYGETGKKFNISSQKLIGEYAEQE
jgi:ribosomal protein S18